MSIARSRLLCQSVRNQGIGDFLIGDPAATGELFASEAGKEKKRVERERRKELRAEIEQEWAEMKHQHNAAVENWTSECSKLQETGLRKKDLPPKPKLGKKPKLPVVEDEDEDEEDEPNEKGDV
ncbi:hypothetical protein R3P38DRAFT_3239715 [Favolaschia claudopus]|uniref:Uncharacterized protein n=1 Tax=Favolaschia claudopus TaxID=2862362 RepID=A0AAV9Z875_9AGAR